MYEEWPFLPSNNRTPALAERWWQECFVRTDAIDSFLGMKHSAAVVGGPGTGKSTALESLMWAQQDRAMFLLYPPERWPHGKHPLKPGAGHMTQILTAAASQFNDLLSQNLALYQQLDDLQKRFLSWLISTHLDLRVWHRLIHRINQATGHRLELPESAPDLYTTGTNSLSIKLQLSELAELAEGFGYERIYLIVDVPETVAPTQLEDMRNMLNWSDLLEQTRLIVRAALPSSALAKARSNARLNLVTLKYNKLERDEILRRHLHVATEGQTELTHLLNDHLCATIENEVVKLYGTSAIAGWLNWLETLLTSVHHSSDTPDLTYTYYRRHVPLLLDTPQQGVWRGPQFLSLDKQPFEILQKLFELRGQPAPEALIDLAGSSTNLNTLASRIRKVIEPGTKSAVYLQNRRDTSYWLENFVLNE